MESHQSKTGAGDEARTRDINLGKVALYQPGETRTRDINLGKVALYQLSYTRVKECEGNLRAGNVNA